MPTSPTGRCTSTGSACESSPTSETSGSARRPLGSTTAADLESGHPRRERVTHRSQLVPKDRDAGRELRLRRLVGQLVWVGDRPEAVVLLLAGRVVDQDVLGGPVGAVD